MDLVKLLAARLGIPADEEGVKKAIEVHLAKSADAMSGLKAVLGALGVEDVDGATKKIAQMFASVDQLEKAMPELASLREGQMESEEDDAGQEVDKAMNTYGMPAACRAALIALRTGGVERPAKGAKPDDVAAYLARRAASKAKFAKEYPAVSDKTLTLTRPAFGSGSGAPPPRVVLNAQPLGQGPVLDLEAMTGNATERALAWVEANDPQAKTLTREEKFTRARVVLKRARDMGQRV